MKKNTICFFKKFLLLLSVTLVAACGSGDDTKSPNQDPNSGSSSGTDSGSGVNHAPEVKITNIKNGDVFFSGEAINVIVEASDVDGNLQQLRFYIDDVITDNKTEAQAEFTIAAGALKAGSHTLRVAAVDEKGEVTNTSVTIEYLVSYIKQNDTVTKLSSGNCSITYNYQISPAFYSSRVVRLYDNTGKLAFFIATHTLTQLTTIDIGSWVYTSSWDYLANSYILWSIYGTNSERALKSFIVSKNGSTFIIDTQIDDTRSLHYEGEISISIN